MESSGGTSSRWWLDPKLVDGYVDGVFEGGGAKGVLYAGALEAVLRRRLWFSAVAGSSAGAITAAMIAAGMQPSDIAAETDKGLCAMVTPSTFSGVRRIRWGTGFLDHAAVLDWLRGVMCTRMNALGVTVDSRGPSFATLFDVTGIELFVAAVDLSARNVAVFTHSLTPNARIAETVMASATIPGGFEPMFFGKEPPWRLFVDGGVASNYPVFVYRDEAFRRYSGLGDHSSKTPIVGFLLDEEPEDGRVDVREVYRDGAFRGHLNDVLEELKVLVQSPESRESTPGSDDASPIGASDLPLEEPVAETAEAWPDPARGRPRFRPRRQRISKESGRVEPHAASKFAQGVQLFALRALTFLAFLLEDRQDPQANVWLWNEPKNPVVRQAITAFRRWLNVSTIPLLLGVAGYTVMFWLGFSVVVRAVVDDVSNASLIGMVIGGIFVLVALLLTILVWALGLGTFFLFRLLSRTAGTLVPGVLETYLNTSAPPWAGHAPNEHLVRLRVPPEITTLRVAPGAPLTGLLKQAEETAFTALAGVTGGPWPVAPIGNQE